MKNDIRCIQRYNNYRKAFSNLTEAIEITKERKLSKLEKQGLIQVFEHTYELACDMPPEVKQIKKDSVA